MSRFRAASIPATGRPCSLRAMSAITLVLLAAISPLGAPTALAQDAVLDLEIGDPARSAATVTLAYDDIVDTRSGERLTPAGVAERLEGVGVLFVGEEHTNMEVHRVQLAVIEALHAAGRDVIIGLEMYPSTEQASLDRWHDGWWTETGFVEGSAWYENWGYHWDYYRDIFLLARDGGMQMVALNAPRDVVSAVTRKGIDGLSEEEAAYLPPRIDTDNDDHFRLFRAYFEGDTGMHAAMSDEQWRSMFASQCTWDATMGFSAVRALEQRGGEDSIVVVLIGSGHVAYGLGAERQARLWFDGLTASLIPIPIEAEDGGDPGTAVEDPETKEGESGMTAGDSGSADTDSEQEPQPTETVRASYADFVWGIPAETAPLYPSIGLSTRVREGELRVLFVGEDSLAGEAGIASGDVLLRLDGELLPNRETLNRLMAGKRWGDSVRLEVRRDDEEIAADIHLRRRR